MDLTLVQAALVLVLGLFAGTVGGLAGVGGSMIMLPGLALLLGYEGPEAIRHHLFIGSAMLVNVVVAFSARARHKKEGAVDRSLVRLLLPSMAIAIVVGVLAGNAVDGTVPKRALGVLLLCYTGYLIWTTARRLPDHPDQPGTRSPGWVVATGGAAGFAGGFLGIGGGVIIVPALVLLARVPLRRAVAASVGVMWITAIIGSALKLLTLGQFGYTAADAAWLALPMAMGAMVGAQIGAWMAHKLRLPWLRLAIAGVLGLAGARMAWPDPPQGVLNAGENIETAPGVPGNEPGRPARGMQPDAGKPRPDAEAARAGSAEVDG
ncbi:MAG: sulfite exporter TauE/SafE family protein [Planctomycetota bacterium]